MRGITEMSELKEKYLEYVDRYKSKFGDMISFDCPSCGEIILTAPSPEGETWNSFSTCPHCDHSYMKYVSGNKVETSL